MKEKLLTVFLMLCVVIPTGCHSSEKYSDVIAVNAQFMKVTEAYLQGLEKAGSASEAAKVMNTFADGLEKVMPTMKKLAEKYPELKNGQNLPESIQASQKQAEQMGMRMMQAMMKIAPFMDDPAVKKAQERVSGSYMADQSG